MRDAHTPADPAAGEALLRRLGVELSGAHAGTGPDRRARSWPQLLTDLDALGREALDRVRRLPHSAADRPTLCTGWSVRDILAHLAEGDRQARRSLAGEDPFDGWDPGRLDAAIDRSARQVDGLGLQASVDRWETARGELLAACRGLDAGAVFGRTAWAAGPISRFALVQARLMETWIHVWDLRAAADPPMVLDDCAFWVSDLGVRSLPYTARLHGLTLNGQLTVELTGTAGGTWHRTFGTDSPNANADANGARLRGPGWAWVLHTSRRLEAAALWQRLEVSGDPAVGRALEHARAFL